MGGDDKGEIVLIPRISLQPNNSPDFPLDFRDVNFLFNSLWHCQLTNLKASQLTMWDLMSEFLCSHTVNSMLHCLRLLQEIG